MSVLSPFAASPSRSLTDIKKIDAKSLATTLKAGRKEESANAGMDLLREAREYGYPLQHYLDMKVEADRKSGLSGFETLCAELNLPFRDDFKGGVTLQAAADAFATFPGTRALFVPVMDEMIRWASRQEMAETVAPLLANSRTVVGNEMITTIVDDDSSDRKANFSVPELGRIPVRSIKATEQSVKFYKHGSGIKTSYEFSRRASLDILTPFVARVARELERDKVRAATNVLINGDGVNAAATGINQSTYNTITGVTATNGTLHWEHLLALLVKRAEAGVPIDTVAMNWDMWFKWNMLFAKPIAIGSASSMASITPAEGLSRAGAALQQQAVAMNLSLRPVLSSAVPANKLLAYSRPDTLSELIEAGSQIMESEQIIANQSVVFYKTETSGYKFNYGDTRVLYDTNA